MAKKQQSRLSYGPNLGLIGGAKAVAESEVAMTSAGGMAFGANFSKAIISGIEEQEKSKAKIDVLSLISVSYTHLTLPTNREV